LSARSDIALGGSVLAIGVVVSLVTFAAAAPGGSYVMAWGAIAFGAFTLGRGLLASSSDEEADEDVALPPQVAQQNARLVSGSISDDDYPTSAIRTGAEGRCVVGFTVNEAGSVCDVDLVESSGHASLDAAACKLIEKRFRFEPARTASGSAIAQRRSQPIVWRLPEDDHVEDPIELRSFDDAPIARDADPWHVLSSRTETMEVFRMTDQERTVMDLVRLAGTTVELCRDALDGPSWIHSPPPSMGVTEKGVALWEPEETAKSDLSLASLPDWAEKHRPAIIEYLRSKGAEVVSGRVRPPIPHGASAFELWFHLKPDDTVVGPLNADGVRTAVARRDSWLSHDPRFNGGRPAKGPDPEAIGYVFEVVGYWYGNTGDPRERQIERTPMLRSYPAELPSLELPDDCWETQRNGYAIYAPAVRSEHVAALTDQPSIATPPP